MRREIEKRIDRFGAGHSSLRDVHRFPVDRIKVDRSFLLRSRTEHETDVVMRAIIDLGVQLGLEVVAEGSRPGSGVSLRAAARERQRAAALPGSSAGGVQSPRSVRRKPVY